MSKRTHPPLTGKRSHKASASPRGTATSRPAALDESDRKILRALQIDGRVSNADLAKQVDLSQSASWTRTRDLFAKGIIKSVRAMIDPRAVQQETAVLVGVVLDRSTPAAFAAFERSVINLPHVLECFLVAGDVDYFMKIRVGGIAEFNDFHAQYLIAIPGVRQVRTFFVLNEIKSDGLLTI